MENLKKRCDRRIEAIAAQGVDVNYFFNIKYTQNGTVKGIAIEAAVGNSKLFAEYIANRYE